MASQVDVYNLGLVNIAAKTLVQSLAEDTDIRRRCDASYLPAIESLLDDHDWNFASSYVALALTADTAQCPWQYQYAYPSNCVNAREIARASDAEDEIPFKIDLNDLGTGKVIHTDRPNAVLRFTRRVTTPGLFSAKAVEAAGWKMSTLLAVSVTGNLDYKRLAEQEYTRVLMEAEASNRNESTTRKAPTPSILSDRS